DASAAANDDDFVGPLMLCPVPDGKDHNTYFVSSEEAEMLMWSVREHDYQLRQRELEQVFAVEAKAPVVTPPTEEPRPLASVGKWRSKLENFYMMRHKGMLMGDSFTREMRELCKDWNEVTGWSHRQMKSRVTQ